MYPRMDSNMKNKSTPKPNVRPKPKAYPMVQITGEKLQRKGGFPSLMRNITSSEMLLFIVSVMMILLGGYILLRPRFTKSTLEDIVDEKLERELHLLDSTIKDMRQKIQTLQEDKAHLENLIKQVDESVLTVRSASEYNITELQNKMEELGEKIQLQDEKLKDLEEKGQYTRESLEEFANTTKENIAEALKQQLHLQELTQAINESVNSLAHVTHNNITVQHNSTSKLTERMVQAEKDVEQYAASAKHIQRIDHTVARLVSSGKIPKSSLIIIIYVVLLYFI